MKQKTRILIYILIAAAAVVLGVLGVLSMRGGSSGDISEHIDLGRKYLIELSYDKAVIEFTEAINIDPNNVDAYLGLAEAYEKIGDIPKAIEWLEKGFAVTGDPGIKEMLDRLRALVDSDSSAVTEGTAVTESETAPSEETTVTESVTEMSNEVRVPYLLGLTEERAIMTCESVGLKCEISYAGSNKAEKGCVFGQAIAAGTMVDMGASVPVEVSEGSVLNVELTAENLEFDYLAEFEESGWAFAVKGNVGGYVNTEGRFVEVYDNVKKERCYLNIGNAEADGEMTVNGYPFIESIYDNEIYINPFKVSEEGIYPCSLNGKWGYANIITGETIIPCSYDGFSAFSCERCFVKSDDNVFILDANGNMLSVDDRIHLKSYYEYCYVNNVALASTDWYTVLIDTDGNVIDDNIKSPPSYPWNTRYVKGILTYISDYDHQYDTNSETWSSVVIGEDGNKICELKGNYIIRFANNDDEGYGFFYNQSNKCNGIFDNKGNIVGEFKACNYYQYFGNNDRLFMTHNDTDWYLYNFKGERICDTAFENGWNTSADLIPAKSNGKWGLIDTDGSMVIDFTYDEMYWNIWDSEYSLLFFLAEKEGKNYIVDRNNNVISEVRGEPLYADKIGESCYIVSCMDNKYYIYKIS